jgi:hypothetical protein
VHHESRKLGSGGGSEEEVDWTKDEEEDPVKEEVKNEVKDLTDPERFLVCVGRSLDFRFRLLIGVVEDDVLAADLGGVGGVALLVVALLPLSLSLPRSNPTSFPLIS